MRDRPLGWPAVLLSLLASLGSCFDCASVPEIEMALNAGAAPERISYGNTIKKERDIARAFALGIRLFAVDCLPEVEDRRLVEVWLREVKRASQPPAALTVAVDQSFHVVCLLGAALLAAA